MSEERALVIVAGYQDIDPARHDFETLTDRAKDKTVALRGAVLVSNDAEDNPVLVETGNRRGSGCRPVLAGAAGYGVWRSNVFCRWISQPPSN